MTCALPLESYYVCQSVGEACERCRINPAFSLLGVGCLIGLIVIVILLITWINKVEKEVKKQDKTK